MLKTAEQIADTVLEKVALSKALARKVLGIEKGLTPSYVDSLAYHYPRTLSRAAGLAPPYPKTRGRHDLDLSGILPSAKYRPTWDELLERGYSQYGNPELTRLVRDRDTTVIPELVERLKG